MQRHMLRIGAEVRSGPEYARAKRYSQLHSLFVNFDKPHGWLKQRTWKEFRRTQYKGA